MQATHFIKALAVTAFCSSAFNTLAATQTWRFIGTVDHLSGSNTAFVAPDWLRPNRSVVIDYAIDMSTPLSSSDFYSGAVKSVLLNGQTYNTSGYVFSWKDSLFGLNTSLSPLQPGGIDFVSFGVFPAPAPGPDLSTLLTNVSQTAFSSMDFLRLDFGNTASVYLRPQSFSAQAVPEPGTLSLSLLAASMFIGAGAIKRMRKTR